MSRISVILITWNEEARLERALESVRWADEIVIVDRGSTDGTEALARRYTDRFYVRPWNGYGVQKQRALELATCDWVLSIDADEAVSPELRAAIERAVAEDDGRVDAYDIELWTWYLGRWFGSRGWAREWKLRLFRRGRVRFLPDEIHEGVSVDGRVRRLRGGMLLHQPYLDLSHEVAKMNRYTRISAVQQHGRGRRSGPLRALGHGVAAFLKEYIVRGGFLYGGAGVVRARMSGGYAFLKHAKIWELGLSPDGAPLPRAGTGARPALREPASLGAPQPGPT